MPSKPPITGKSPAQFEEYLQSIGQSYINLEPLAGSQTRLQFVGAFQQKPTLWYAELTCLHQVAKQYFAQHPDTTSVPLQSCLQVGDLTPSGRQLWIRIPIETINHSDIVKTLIMIRKYKRLRYGTHYFGEVFHFQISQ